MKTIDSFWFTNSTTVALGPPPFGTVGIVVGEDEHTGERKVYIGTAQGFEQKADEEHILEWGTEFKAERIEVLMQLLKKKETER